MIHVEHLTKTFGAVTAVNDVSFNVAQGEVVGLLGPNGAGKTTTMRIITGYLPASEGQVMVGGMSVAENNLKIKAQIGYLPENAPLYLDLNVSEYLSYIANLRGLKKPDLKEAVRVCGLKEVFGRPIGQLSRGFRQRVGLAGALLHQPPILILDEPTSGLDPNQIVEIRNLIRDIGRERTVILSTHIMQEVEATCSKVLIINEGRLVAQGALAELKSRNAGAVYTVTVRAPHHQIQEKFSTVPGLKLKQWTENAGIQKMIFESSQPQDLSEEIFRLVVAHGWTLSELTRETASLEEVFRELTRE